MYRNHAPRDPFACTLHECSYAPGRAIKDDTLVIFHVPFLWCKVAKDHFPLFSESIHHNMDIATAWTPAGTNLTRPPPENIPLDVIRLNRAGDSQRNANGLIPGQGGRVLNINGACGGGRLRPPVVSPALRTLMLTRHVTATADNSTPPE